MNHNNSTMKKTLLSTFSILAAVVTVFLFSANTAEARGHSHGTTTYVSHYTSCGCPVYVKKVFWKHDCYGRPIYRYYRQPVTHRCNRYNHHNRSRYHNSYNGCNNNRYYRSNRNYHHSRYYRSSGCNSGISITYRR